MTKHGSGHMPSFRSAAHNNAMCCVFKPLGEILAGERLCAKLLYVAQKRKSFLTNAVTKDGTADHRLVERYI